ncbi:MAG: hypothetical protein ABIB93_07425, partial [Chloroflexota bacterium]
PFSHACEKVLLPQGVKHEDISQYIIKHYTPIGDVIKSNKVNPDNVALILGDKVPFKFSIFHKIISGIFDADKADYLLRDSYNCGVSYGHYDYSRYISAFDIGEQLQLSIDEGSVHAIEAFLLARFHYYMQIPYHRTRTGLDRVLEEYMKKLKETKRLPNIITGNNSSPKSIKVNFERFTFFDDYDIFQKIKSDYQKSDKWAKILMRENHLTPVYDYAGTDEGHGKSYRDYIDALNKKGLKENDDFIKYEDKIEVHGITSESKEKGETGDVIKVVDKRGNIKDDFIRCSLILEPIAKKPVYILRVYATSDKKQIMNDILNELENCKDSTH